MFQFFTEGKYIINQTLVEYQELKKSALHSIESFKSNLSEYLYLYDDIMDVPIIIDGLIQATTEMGYAQEEQSISVISVQKNNIKVDRRKLKMNHVSLSEDFVKRASARNIYPGS